MNAWWIIAASVALVVVRLMIAAVCIAREERRPRVSRRDEFCTDDPTVVGIWHVGD